MYRVKTSDQVFETSLEGGDLLKVNDQLVTVEDRDGVMVAQSQDGKALEVEIEKIEGNHAIAWVNGKRVELELDDEEVILQEKFGWKSSGGVDGSQFKSPMPGKVLKVFVSEGDEIEKGAPVMVLEAMKMENVLKAPGDLKIKEVGVEAGDSVDKSQVLISFF